jgi:CubicO group peptidase (beta-lactamase class C family)
MMNPTLAWRTVVLRAIRALGMTLCFAGPVALNAQEPFPGFDAYVNKALQTWHVPGISIAVVRNDSVIYTKGYGVLKFGAAQPVNDQSLFEIGSSTKAFTATVVAMLVGDGKMRYDDHLSDYLPGFKMADPTASNDVTLRDALTHRSGIARGELAWLGAGITRDQVLHRVRFIKPESPFRSKFSYQNMMYLAAGEAAAHVANNSWDDLVRQRIFTPLGMASSTTDMKTLASNPNVATPHGIDHDSVWTKPHMDITYIAPAGAILSNARDMAQWLRLQLGDGVFDGKRLVASAALRETHTPQILTGGFGREAGDTASTTFFSSYGMGWFVEDYHRRIMWQHGGNTDGMTAAVGMLPEQHFGVAVLSNMAGAQLPAILMHYIFDRQLGLPMRDLSAETRARYMAQMKRVDSMQVSQAGSVKTNAEPPAPLSAFVGTYADSLYGEATVTLVENHLELARGEWHGPLVFKNANNVSWTIYPSSPINPMPLKFEIGADGKVTGLYFGIGGDVDLMGRKALAGRGRGGR